MRTVVGGVKRVWFVCCVLACSMSRVLRATCLNLTQTAGTCDHMWQSHHVCLVDHLRRFAMDVHNVGRAGADQPTPYLTLSVDSCSAWIAMCPSSKHDSERNSSKQRAVEELPAIQTWRVGVQLLTRRFGTSFERMSQHQTKNKSRPAALESRQICPIIGHGTKLQCITAEPLISEIPTEWISVGMTNTFTPEHS